ncbi:MAG: hypothetical protein JW955_05330, partial [Sedimentisphaerales bacterium]|nr:hypothetical protein [Sedimentisphaerales bacterium]
MHTWNGIFLIATFAIPSLHVNAQSEPASDWIDPNTGHRVVRLSREPGSQSSYFHQNEFTPDGRKLVFTSPTGLYTVDLQTHEVEQIRAGRTWLLCVGRKTGLAYYMSRGEQGAVLCAVDPNTKEDKKIVDIPRGLAIANINCDETLVGGTFDRQRPQGFGGPRIVRDATAPTTPAAPEDWRTPPRSSQRPGFGTPNTHRDMELVTLDLKSGEVKKFNQSHAWLNHVQFSPTDPHQMLFCHEGTWQLMDRTWIIRTDG